MKTEARVEVTEAVREWEYGDYEGLTSKEINAARAEKGEEVKFDIWKHGCPGGEYVPSFNQFDWSLVANGDRSPQDITRRVDALIDEIRTNFHSKAFGDQGEVDGDVLIVAHGHILRAFAMRWTGMPLEETSLILEAGGVGTLR